VQLQLVGRRVEFISARAFHAFTLLVWLNRWLGAHPASVTSRFEAGLLGFHCKLSVELNAMEEMVGLLVNFENEPH